MVHRKTTYRVSPPLWALPFACRWNVLLWLQTKVQHASESQKLARKVREAERRAQDLRDQCDSHFSEAKKLQEQLDSEVEARRKLEIDVTNVASEVKTATCVSYSLQGVVLAPESVNLCFTSPVPHRMHALSWAMLALAEG